MRYDLCLVHLVDHPTRVGCSAFCCAATPCWREPTKLETAVHGCDSRFGLYHVAVVLRFIRSPISLAEIWVIKFPNIDAWCPTPAPDSQLTVKLQSIFQVYYPNWHPQLFKLFGSIFKIALPHNQDSCIDIFMYTILSQCFRLKKFSLARITCNFLCFAENRRKPENSNFC